MKNTLGVIAALCFIAASIGCTAFLRDRGINSCEDRGGTAVVSSWLSEDAWDVKCIEP